MTSSPSVAVYAHIGKPPCLPYRYERVLRVGDDKACEGHAPAVFTDNPLKAILKEGETFEELCRKVQYCEITWPQCYVMGEPIRIKTCGTK